MRDRCEVLDWAASGAMALTGMPEGAPVASPAPALAMLAQVSAEFARVTARLGNEVRADPAELIAGRAALAGFTRGGRVSAGGSSFLLRSADGWCAVTLSRPDDVAAVPSIAGLLGADGDRLNAVATLAEARSALTAVALGTKADDFAAAAQLVGVPAAALPPGARPPGAPPPGAPRPGARSSGAGEASLAGATGWPPWRATRIAEPLADGGLGGAGLAGGGLAGGGLAGAELAGAELARTGLAGTGLAGTGLAGAVVADLSSMWAGPLCARLLGLAGANVIKVESPTRPDGARSGNREFFDWLHAGHRSLSVDFSTREGRAVLTALLEVADVVIESSRPRALAALGVAPGMIRHPPGQVWLSITGYGRSMPERVAFGDDAAVAGGLVGWTEGEWAVGESVGPVFCADAIADPLTGACGALAVALSRSAGGGELVDLPMRDVAAAFAAAGPDYGLPDHGPHDILPGGVVSCPRMHREQAVLMPRRPASPGSPISPGGPGSLGSPASIGGAASPGGLTGHAAELGADSSAVLGWLADRRAAC